MASRAELTVNTGKDKIVNVVRASGPGLIASAAAQAKKKQVKPTIKTTTPTITGLRMRLGIHSEILIVGKCFQYRFPVLRQIPPGAAGHTVPKCSKRDR